MDDQLPARSSDQAPNALDRRRFLFGLLASGAALATISSPTGYASHNQDKTFPDDEDEDEDDDDSPVEGSGNGEAGIALLQSWMEGETRQVIVSDPGWVYTLSRVSNFAVYVPTSWDFFEQSDPTPGNFADGFTTTSTVSSPDDDALFYVYDVALLPYLVTTEAFVQSVFETLADGKDIELIEEEYDSLLAEDDAVFAAARIGDSIAAIQAFGSVFNSQGSATSSYSSTIQIGAAAQFNDLTEQFFLPMLSNFQRFSGGSGDPTPTPSPAP